MDKKIRTSSNKSKRLKMGGIILSMKNAIILMAIAVIATSVVLVGFKNTASEKVKTPILMATTTSTENSGLLDYLLPYFEEVYGYDVEVIAVGTGKALQMGADGEVDVLLVHAKESEIEFINAGHGLERFDVMYNDFVIIGPKKRMVSSGAISNDCIETFSKIYNTSSTFLSRGDDSGTHKKELQIFAEAGINPVGDWYKSTGKGMGDTIMMANELLGYTLSDRATYLSMSKDIDLEIVTEGDAKLFNQYGVIAVNPNKNDKINTEGADDFIEWILSDEAQALIGEFGVQEYGQSLFIPNAK